MPKLRSYFGSKLFQILVRNGMRYAKTTIFFRDYIDHSEFSGLMPSLKPSTRRIARQRFPDIRLGNSELSGDLCLLDARFEGGANGVQLPNRQLNADRFAPPLA